MQNIHCNISVTKGAHHLLQWIQLACCNGYAKHPLQCLLQKEPIIFCNGSNMPVATDVTFHNECNLLAEMKVICCYGGITSVAMNAMHAKMHTLYNTYCPHSKIIVLRILNIFRPKLSLFLPREKQAFSFSEGHYNNNV